MANVGRPKGLPKTGGRQKGTLSKRKDLLLSRLQREFPNYHPIVELVKIAHDPESSIDQKLNANKEVAKYVEPQLRAIEHTSDGSGPVIISANPMSLEEWKKANDESS